VRAPATTGPGESPRTYAVRASRTSRPAGPGNSPPGTEGVLGGMREAVRVPAEVSRGAPRTFMAPVKAVYERGVELGLTQGELEERVGIGQGKASRIEGSDTVPTLPLRAGPNVSPTGIRVRSKRAPRP